MSESSFGSTTAATCRTEWKRQKMYHKTEKLLIIKETTKDPLPIVELKPFVKKVWRREKSFPVYYDHLREIAKLTSKQSNRSRDTERNERPQSPVTSPEKVEMIIQGLTNDHQRTKTIVQPDSPRCRPKLHPSADAKQSKMLEHSQSMVPGFITREERGKSTLMEIQLGESLKIQNGLHQTLEKKENEKPTILNMNGDKISENGRRSGNFVNQFRNMYSRASAWQDENSVRGYSRRSLKRQSESPGSKTPFYDAFDRKGTLPSLQVCYTALRQKPPKGRGVEDFDSPRDPAASPIHTVGGIANSLHVLSKLGNPTGIEHQISLQLEVDLRRFRRSRDYFPFDMTPSEIAKYYPPSTLNMTHGELLLRKGLESNTSRRKRALREKSHKSAPDKLETTPAHINYIREVTEEQDLEDVEPINVERKILESVTSEILSSPDNSKSAIHNEEEEFLEYEERVTPDNVPNRSMLQPKSALTEIAEVESHEANSSLVRENTELKTPVTVPSAKEDIELRELASSANSELINDVSDANDAEGVFEELDRDPTQLSDRTFLTSAMSVIN